VRVFDSIRSSPSVDRSATRASSVLSAPPDAGLYASLIAESASACERQSDEVFQTCVRPIRSPGVARRIALLCAQGLHVRELETITDFLLGGQRFVPCSGHPNGRCSRIATETAARIF
jgi:hypothetical protein